MNTVDGMRGNLKTAINRRGCVNRFHLLEFLKEFQWRGNIGDKDPFITLVEHIRDGYFPF